MRGREIDFVVDEGFRGLVSFLRESQREFDKAETDDAIKLTRAKLDYANELLDSHIRRARNNRRLTRDSHMKRYGKHTSGRALAVLSNNTKKTRH